MAKLTSKSQLIVGTNLTINETAKTIAFIASADGSTTNGLIAKDGVTLQALYSKLVDLWATASYQDSPFPMYAIDALSGQFQIGTDGATFSGWTFADDATRNMLRDGGWSEYSAGGVLEQQYAGFIGLGSITPALTVQPYYHLAPSDAPTNFPFTDQFNVGVKVYGDATHGNFDKRTFAKTFVREYGKKFKSSVLADTGATGTGANKVNFLVSNEDDLKIQALLGTNQATGDAAMASGVYIGITISYYTADQTKTIGGTGYPFRIIIQGNGGTLEQIYAKVQYLLRQNSNINTAGTAGTVTGKTAADLLTFVGDTLVTSQGVFIDGVLSVDSNRVEFYDQNNVKRVNPYTSAWSISCNAPLRGAGSSYRLLFTSPPGAGNDYGEAGAITVNDASGVPITGVIPANGEISGTYDYDGNVQGGFTPGTDRAVTLIGIKPGSGKFVVAQGTLVRSKSMGFSLVAEQDRVYAA